MPITHQSETGLVIEIAVTTTKRVISMAWISCTHSLERRRPVCWVIELLLECHIQSDQIDKIECEKCGHTAPLQNLFETNFF